MRSRSATAPRKSSASTLRADPPFELPAQTLGRIGPRDDAPGQHDARKPAAAQPILVIHRRLMDEIRQVAVASRTAALRKKIRSPPRTIAIVL